MHIQVQIRKDTRQKTNLLVTTEIQTAPAEAAVDQTANRDQLVDFSFLTSRRQDHGVCGPYGEHRCSLRQRGFLQESPESNSERSIVSFCGELHRDPVLIRGLHFSYELWEEDPGVQKQTQHELAPGGRMDTPLFFCEPLWWVSKLKEYFFDETTDTPP